MWNLFCFEITLSSSPREVCCISLFLFLPCCIICHGMILIFLNITQVLLSYRYEWNKCVVVSYAKWKVFSVLCVTNKPSRCHVVYKGTYNPFLRKKNPFHIVFHILQQQLEKYNRVYICIATCAASSKAGNMCSEQCRLCTLTNTTTVSAKIIATKQWHWIQKTG